MGLPFYSVVSLILCYFLSNSTGIKDRFSLWLFLIIYRVHKASNCLMTIELMHDVILTIQYLDSDTIFCNFVSVRHLCRGDRKQSM